ncbi:hypothetical protein BY996DRAFT_2715986 [Phakopsora pachyrhizi]|nr:hypothetical protein BY996DRAFT_2715986 [Phakopsora pachyrhizi]
MSNFQDLPEEVLDEIIKACFLYTGRSTLVKLLTLNRSLYSKVQPILAQSIDLTEFDDERQEEEESEEKEFDGLDRMFRGLIYDFLPIHRLSLTQISIFLTPTNLKSNWSRFQYDLYDIFEDPLDRIYSDILGLSKFLSNLTIKFSNSSSHYLQSSDYPLTISSVKRLTRLQSLSLSGSRNPSDSIISYSSSDGSNRLTNLGEIHSRPHQPSPSSQDFLALFLSSALPSLRSLESLSLEKLSLILTQAWWPSSVPSVSISNLRLYQIKIWPSTGELYDRSHQVPMHNFLKPFLENLKKLEISIDQDLVSPFPFNSLSSENEEDSNRSKNFWKLTEPIGALKLRELSIEILKFEQIENDSKIRSILKNPGGEIIQEVVKKSLKSKHLRENVRNLTMMFRRCPIELLRLRNVLDDDDDKKDNFLTGVFDLDVEREKFKRFFEFVGGDDEKTGLRRERLIGFEELIQLV